jgi:hypothetical protein
LSLGSQPSLTVSIADELSPEATLGEGLAFLLWSLDVDLTPSAEKALQLAQWPVSAAATKDGPLFKQ